MDVPGLCLATSGKRKSLLIRLEDVPADGQENEATKNDVPVRSSSSRWLVIQIGRSDTASFDLTNYTTVAFPSKRSVGITLRSAPLAEPES